MRFVPHEYQKDAIRWLVQKPEAALLMAPGLGKSSCALSALIALQKARGSKRALVIAPLRVAQLVWSHEGEIGKWDEFKHLKVVLLHGPEKDRRINESADLYVINFDGLPWLIHCGTCHGDGKAANGCGLLGKCKRCDGSGTSPHFRALLARGVDTLIVDELSKLKHTKTQRHKTLKPHLGRFSRRWGLTGSPASNGLLDLFGQMYVLDLGRTLGRYITHYRHAYFTPTGFMGKEWALQSGADARIYQAIKDVALSMRAEDHLDLPELVERNIWVSLPPKARKTYDELERDLLTQIDNETVVAANVAVASGKCRQVASGGLYNDAREVLHVHDEKTNALVDLVDELQGAQLCIGYEFEHDLIRIRKGLGYDVPAINGSTNAKEASRLVQAWNAGTLPILCGHPAAMGHGLNLQASGHHVCWYSPTWNFELYDQFIRRFWRQGQKNRVIVHRILTRKTVDEAVIRALSSKRRGQDALFAALKELRR